MWLLAIFLTKAGSVAQVVPTTDGLTSYAGTTTTRHQLTCGEDPPYVVIREWRYGPRQLRVDDDDDDDDDEGGRFDVSVAHCEVNCRRIWWKFWKLDVFFELILSSGVASAVWTHASAVVTQFAIFMSYFYPSGYGTASSQFSSHWDRSMTWIVRTVSRLPMGSFTDATRRSRRVGGINKLGIMAHSVCDSRAVKSTSCRLRR